MPQHQRSLLGRIARIVGFPLAALLILILAAASGFAWWFSQTDLKIFVERQASAALGRKVTLATFTVRWGDPLAIDDLTRTNAALLASGSSGSSRTRGAPCWGTLD